MNWKKKTMYYDGEKYGKAYEPDPKILDYVIDVRFSPEDKIMVVRKGGYIKSDDDRYAFLIPKEGFMLTFKTLEKAKDWIIGQSDNIQDT